MTQDLQELVDQYLVDPRPSNREAVVLAAVPLVRSLIGKLSIPKHPLASYEDLESVGLVGLMQALDNYDPERARFVTHAYQRIRGALIDYLRSIDVLSRGKRKKLGQIQQATDTLRQMLGHEPDDADVSSYLNLSIDEYHKLLSDAQRRFSLSLFNPIGQEEGSQTMLDILPDEHGEEGFAAVEQSTLVEVLESLIKTLPERQQTILSLYYMEDLTLREIGEVLDLTEARISQILGKLLITLRTNLMEVRSSAL